MGPYICPEALERGNQHFHFIQNSPEEHPEKHHIVDICMPVM
ncbi:hypothetical protein [Methanolobus profundi]|nr:hypothetical protein [Methanolobus profundi]